MRYCGIHLSAVSQEIINIYILDMSLKITNLNVQLHLPGVNEFKIHLLLKLERVKKNGKTSLCGQGDLFHCNEEQEFSLFGKYLPVASWNIPYLDQYDSY